MAPLKALLDSANLQDSKSTSSIRADYPSSSSVNTKTNMSSLRDSSSEESFTRNLCPPINLPLRIPGQTPALAALDENYQRNPRDPLGENMRADNDDRKGKEAMKVLEQHIRDRLPYMQLASMRLQAVLGLRNESVFDLPEESLKSSAGLRPLYSIGEMRSGRRSLDAGSKAKAAARRSWRKGSGSTALKPRSPLGMHTVDKETGKGLREFLLQKGKEMGMTKRECKSIAFHDFTPDMRTDAHRNVLLGHYGVGDGVSRGERIDFYEVDLPITNVNEETKEENQSAESWIWILISRPVISLDASDKSTTIQTCSPTLSSAATTTRYPTQPLSTPDSPPSSHPLPPPNFPRPAPISWMVFAAPLAHVTAYPETIEKPDPAPSSPGPAYPFLSQQGKKVFKRRDYDFSHCGVPIFEFNSGDLFASDTSRMSFLSVENIGPWHEGDPFEVYSTEEYAELVQTWKEAAGYGSDSDGKTPTDGQQFEAPCPNQGVWWETFYARLYHDCRRWEAVKAAMSKGKCRVILRWTELEVGSGNRDVMMGEEQGSEELGIGEKRELAMGRHKRLTRSETRKRSALGLGGDPTVGAVVEAGLSDTLRSRTLANREMGRGGACEKEKKRDMRIRKR